MKKKLFFSIIPLCLTLGACSSPIKDSDKTPLFETAIEDTEGHDDLFINADIKYLDPTPVFNEEPRIGIQSIAGDGVTSIRFVGAVSLTDVTGDGVVNESDLTGNQKVKWNLAAYNANGSVHITRGIASATKIYKSIGASGESYSINAYNEANNTNFTHFVTYVIRKIPDSASKATLQLYLFVGDVTNVVSKCIITTVDLTTKYYTNYNQGTGYYAIKKSADGCEVINATSVSSNNIMFNYTQSVNLTLNENDSVIFVNNNSGTYLSTKGFSFAYNDPTLSEKDGDSDFIKVKESGNYVLRYGSNGICLNKAGAENFGNKPMIYADGKTALYGIYPTYNITDTSLISALNTAYPNKYTPTWVTTKNDSKYTSPYFFEYNGEYYAKLESASAYNTDIVYSHGGVISGQAWFKCEPILWDAVSDTKNNYGLSENQRILFSRHVLDAGQFANVGPAEDNYLKYIGTALNENAYSIREKAFMLGDSSLETYKVYDKKNLKLFLPSTNDLNSSFGLNNTTRKRSGTDWMKANGGYTTGTNSVANYWTQTTYSSTKSKAYIVITGGTTGSGPSQTKDKTDVSVGICPCVIINL